MQRSVTWDIYADTQQASVNGKNPSEALDNESWRHLYCMSAVLLNQTIEPDLSTRAVDMKSK